MSNRMNSIKIQGFSFIELLIAIFIFAFVLLSIIATENFGLVESYNSYLSGIANVQLNNIAERFYAGVGMKEFSAWQKENAMLLPRSSSSYHSVDAMSSRVELCWQPRSLKMHCLSATIPIPHV
jgi:prepilin-type N-terminal cleavage/methylation domain-containing protein